VFGGERPGYVDTRYGNPTVAALEGTLATLEGGETAGAYASGIAAIPATLPVLTLVAGDTVVVAQDVYKATSIVLMTVFACLGMNVRLVDMTDPDQVERTMRESHPKVVMAGVSSNMALPCRSLGRCGMQWRRIGFYS